MMALAPQTSFDPDFASHVEWAWMYRSYGLQVVPGKMPKDDPNSWKRPALATWASEHSTFVPDFTFQRWYGDGGEFVRRQNMGLVTGRGSELGNIFVIDLDTHKTPEAGVWWQGVLWENNGGHELKTWTQTTGGGGRQIFLRAPAGWRAPTNRTSSGVDIRGQGGFAVLPPSLHNTGREYAWDRGLAPYDGLDILDAPQWLLDAVDEIVEQHGGHKGAEIKRTPNPSSDYDSFGRLIDGRETYMTKVVWGAVVDWHRESPIQPPKSEWEDRAREAYAVYENGVDSRLDDPSVTKSERLERENRGASAFKSKWVAAMRQWDKKVAEAAREGRPFETVDSIADAFAPPIQEHAAPPKEDAEGKPLPLILTAEQFIAGFTPPDYLIDGMLQRGYLYSLTARTGHGKTAVGMYLAQSIARGEAVKNRVVKQGAVLYLAGENPDDIRARFLVLADSHGFNPADVPIHFIAGVVNIEESLPAIREGAAKIPDLMLVIVDTAAAYFRGDDGNSNVQQGGYARLLRELSFLPGKPAVLVMSHPVKNASRENLLPVGGGAFLNEVDGNLTLWADAEKHSTLHWQGKFRGPEFDPVTFRLDTATCDAVHDSNGELIPSVVASPVSDMEMEATQSRQEADEDRVLITLGDNKNVSIKRLAELCGFVNDDGLANKAKAFRILRRLADDKLVENLRGKYRLTAKGQKEIGQGDD